MNTAPVELPVTIEGVTAGWLTSAIGTNFPGVAVLRARTPRMLWGTSTKLMIQVDYNDRGRAAGLPSRWW